MLRPKQRKFKKHHLYKVGKTVKRKTHLVYGEFGLASEEFSLLSDSQIEVIIMTLKRQLKRKGKLWLRVYPHIPVTKKPLETRMGKGKGAVEFWQTRVAPGSVIVEIGGGISSIVAEGALALIKKKLPFKCKFLVKKSQVV